MTTALDAQGRTPPPNVRLAREIVSRLRGGRPDTSPDWQALLASTGGAERFLLERPFAVKTLSGRELEAAAFSLGVSTRLLKDNAEQREPPKAKASPRNALVVPSLEAASDHPPEFATDLFKLTACDLTAEADRAKSDGAAGAQAGCTVARVLRMSGGLPAPAGTPAPGGRVGDGVPVPVIMTVTVQFSLS